MKIVIRRFCLIVIVLLAIIDTIQSDTNETNNTEVRKGRVNGRIVKLYSGTKPDPILCLEEGFKADPVDCTVFYRCTKAYRGKYSVFRFQCGPGTVYDPENEVCNHPRNTKRSECGGLIPPVIPENEREIEELPSPINSTSPVYTTHIEEKNVTAFTTASTTQKIEQYTDYKPITTVSYPSVATTEQEYLESSNNLQNYPWSDSKNKTEHVVMHFTTTTPNTEKGFPCTSEGFIGDSENCRKFYRCVSNSRGGFIRYEFLCSESTVWDDNIQSCNHAWAARNRRCGRSDFSNKNSTIINNQSNNVLLDNKEIENNYGATINEQQNYNSIKEIDNTNSQYGNKLNNDKYTKNIHNPYTLTTSAYQDTLVSKMEDKIYDKYEESDIKGQNDDINEINHYRVTTSSYFSNDFQHNYTTQSITGRKNIQCIQSGFMADPVDCKKFYRCVDNGRGSFTKYEFSCSQETVWDSKLEACNYAWAVKECGGTLSGENPNNEVATNNPIIPSTNKEYDDNGYVNQINQEREQTTSSTILTTISLLLTTESPKGMSVECVTTGFFGDPNDCQKFYRCINNEKGSFTKYDYICGDGTLWDQNIQACNHAWAVNSCNQSTIDNQSNQAAHTTPATNGYESSPITTVSYVQTTVNKNTNNDDYDSGYSHQQMITTLNPSRDDLKTTFKNPHIQQNNCQFSGFMGDIKDCKKFYRCVDNGNGGFTRHEFSCGEGTVWDSEIEACNHAWAVKQCGGVHNIKEEVTSHVPDDDLNIGQTTQIYNTLSTSQISSREIQTTTKQTSIMTDYSQCETNGFMGDKFDCKKFYRCVDSGDGKYIRYEFSCGEGTVWDSKIQACNHAWAVEECGSNVHIETTHNINDVSVRPSTSPSYEDAINGYTTQSTTKLDDQISTTTLGSSTVTNSKQQCQSSGFMGDQNDCKKFYRCVDNGNGGFTKHEFSCGQGTAWDSKIEACNHEHEVQNCGIYSESQSEATTSFIQSQNDMQITTSSSNNIITQIQQSHTEAVYSPTTSLPDVDRLPSEENECTSEGFFGNTNDCKRFFRCVNNGKGSFIRYDFSCGDGTLWVQELQACDHDTNEISCNYTLNAASTEKYEISSSTDNLVILNTTDSSESNIHNNEKCVSEGFYANLNDCRRFYRCVNDGNGRYTKYEFSCAEGTAWDVNTGSCNSINKVKGCQSTENINNNTPVMQNEQVSESESNMSTTNPTTSTSTTEDTKPTSKNECQQDGYFGNIEDCRKFYRCVSKENGGYTKYNYDCGEGTIWDQDITACNHPQDVTNPSCSSDQGSSSITISSSSQYTTEDNTKSPEITSSPIATSTASSTNKNETNSTCSNSESLNEKFNDKNMTCKKAGFYANPNDCKKFYRCVDWDNNGEKFSVFHFECGDGTIWDPSLDTCNHIDSVYPPRTCNGTSQQSENMTESSSTTETISTTTNQDETSSTVSDSTTEQTTTQQTTPQQTTPQQTTTQQTTAQQTTAHQTTAQQTTAQQTTAQQTTTQRTTTQQTTPQQTTIQQSTVQQTTIQQTTKQETTTQQTTAEQTTTEQQSTTQQQSTTEQSTESIQTSTTEKSTTQQATTTESDQTTTQRTQEQTTKSSTEPITSSEESTVSESSTTESTDQSSTTEQVITSTQPLNTEENTSQTESQSSTTETSTTENEHQSSTESNTSNQNCPETDEDQYLLVCPTSFKRHPKYCNLFYQCTEDNDSHEMKVATFNCPNNTIYDESKVQCVEEDKSDEKCNGEIAKKYRVKRLGIRNNEPIVVTKESMACPSVGHFPFEKREECSAALLKCEKTKSGKLRGYIYKCPEGYVYWSISRRCESLNKLRDCKKPFEEWNKRYDIPVEKYNIAH